MKKQTSADNKSAGNSKALAKQPTRAPETRGEPIRRSRLARMLDGLAIYVRGWQAGIVLKMDERFKRDPLVSQRLKHLKAQQELLQLMIQNPTMRKKLPAGIEEQARYMNMAMGRMDQVVKKRPDLTMKQLTEMAQDPELQKPVIRTRPGPPMPGRRR